MCGLAGGRDIFIVQNWSGQLDKRGIGAIVQKRPHALAGDPVHTATRLSEIGTTLVAERDGGGIQGQVLFPTATYSKLANHGHR